MTGAEHLSFNTCILEKLHKKNKIRKIYCSALHYQYFSNTLKKIPMDNVKVIDGKSRRFFSKLCIEIYNVFRILLRPHKKYLFLSVFPPVLCLLAFLNIIFRKRITVFLHGELNGLRELNNNITSYAFWVKLYFKSGLYKYIENIVVGEHIKKGISEVHYINPDELKYINHPIVPMFSNKEKDIDCASIGYANGKAYDELFESISKLDKPFIHIGMVSNVLYEKYKSSCIKFHAMPGNALSYDRYLSLISRTKYGIFMYAHDYSFTTSGAMLDAMSNNTVILTIANTFAAYLDSIDYPVVSFDSSEKLFEQIDNLPDYDDLLKKHNPIIARKRFSELSSDWVL